MSRMRSFLIPFLFAVPTAAFGQSTRCVAARVARDEYRGECTNKGERLGSLFVRRVADRPVGLWRGSMFRGNDTLPITVDTRPGGALQLGRSWLVLSDVTADGEALRFSYDDAAPLGPSQADLDILRRARRYLEDSVRWNRADTTDMAAAPVRGFSCAPAPKQSLFCALYLASIDATGDYAHFRPAVNAVRAALAQVSNKQYRHPLVDFNNDRENDISDVLGTLDLAIKLVETRRATPKQ